MILQGLTCVCACVCVMLTKVIMATSDIIFVSQRLSRLHALVATNCVFVERRPWGVWARRGGGRRRGGMRVEDRGCWPWKEGQGKEWRLVAEMVTEKRE